MHSSISPTPSDCELHRVMYFPVTDASAAVSGGRIFLRGGKQLFCIQMK